MRWLLALVAVTSVARADGFYYTEGVGGTRVKDDLSARLPSAVHIYTALGMRTGNYALEAFYGADLTYPEVLDEYGVALKYIQPLSQHFLVYLRGSASVGFGAGVALKGKVRALGFLWWPFFFMPLGPKVTAAITLDDGYDFYRLHGPSPTAIDAQLTHLTLGFAVGSDF